MPTKILAIDDSKTMRLAIKITFAAEDAEVVAVSKGSEAVARAKQMKADVVLVDVSLAAGEPSGYDVSRALKADPATAAIPVYLLASNQAGVDTAELANCGAAGVITKPFDSQQLIDVVAGRAAAPAPRPGSAAARPAAAPVAAAGPSPAPVAAAPAPARPAVAAPPAGPPVGAAVPRPMAAPVPAARPVAAPAPAVAAAPAAAAGVAAPPAAAARVAAPPAAAAGPLARPASASAPVAAASAGPIPIAVPIPFAPTSAPTPGMLARLQQAGGSASGLDPAAVAALLALSRDVVEQVVWEVVPDLAEQILREQRPG